MEKKLPLSSTIFTAILLGLVGGAFIASADENLLSAAERYQAPSLPGRDDLMSQIPELPFSPPLDPTVARQQGARELQGLNPNQSLNPDTMLSTVNKISAEDTNPSRLSGVIPSSASGITNRITNAQSPTNAQIPLSALRSPNSPNDPLGQDPQAAARLQSDVTRSGTLPRGVINVTGGDPLGLGGSLSAAAASDIANAYNNALAARLALKLQTVNRQAERLAGKLDSVNTSAAELNETSSDFVEVLNDILKKLPTLPRL